MKVTIRKPPVIKSIPIRTSADRLLTQAKLCLDNKRVDDRLKPKVQKYLIDTPKGEEILAKQRFTFVRSKTTLSHRDSDEYFYFAGKFRNKILLFSDRRRSLFIPQIQ